MVRIKQKIVKVDVVTYIAGVDSLCKDKFVNHLWDELVFIIYYVQLDIVTSFKKKLDIVTIKVVDVYPVEYMFYLWLRATLQGIFIKMQFLLSLYTIGTSFY